MGWGGAGVGLVVVVVVVEGFLPFPDQCPGPLVDGVVDRDYGRDCGCEVAFCF